jgi:two-component sensor histidine kinase
MYGTKLSPEQPSPRQDASQMSEIHHRVKNHFQVIISLLNLQIDRIRNKEIARPLQATLNRVRAVAAMHERSYATPDFATIHLGPYLNYLVGELRQMYDPSGRIKVNVETADLAVDARRASGLALISSELVANAFEHAFPNGRSGTISLRLAYAAAPRLNEPEGSALLEIVDDGIGLPDDVDVQTVDSMSFELVRMLTLQLQATLNVNTSPAGTSYRLTFPL